MAEKSIIIIGAGLAGLFDMLKMLKMMRMMRTMRKYSKVSTQEYASRFNDSFLREVFPFLLDDMPGFPMMAVLNALAALDRHKRGLAHRRDR